MIYPHHPLASAFHVDLSQFVVKAGPGVPPTELTKFCNFTIEASIPSHNGEGVSFSSRREFRGTSNNFPAGTDESAVVKQDIPSNGWVGSTYHPDGNPPAIVYKVWESVSLTLNPAGLVKRSEGYFYKASQVRTSIDVDNEFWLICSALDLDRVQWCKLAHFFTSSFQF